MFFVCKQLLIERLLNIILNIKMKCLTLKSMFKMKLIFNNLKSIKCLRLYSQTIGPKKYSFNEKTLNKLNIKNALISKPSDKLVSISGWIKSTRKQKPIFLHINDGSIHKHLQVVINEEEVKCPTKDLYNGCCVRCIGRLVASPGKQQSVELICQSIEVIGECDPSVYPFAQRNTTYKMPYFRDYLHLRVRNQLFQSMARIRSEAINAIHIFMKQNDFINVTTPLITSNDCEGGGHVFTVRSPYCSQETEETYFSKQAFLTVSAQLHLEAMTGGLSRVYTLSQCFRAERSLSRKHLSEFLMFEAEEAFIDSLDDLMNRVETICKFIGYYLRHNCEQDFNYVVNDTKYKYFDKILNSKYIRMTYEEAINILQKSQKFPKLKFGNDLNSEQENLLVEYNDNIPVFVTHFPSNVKPFYMKQINGQALCFDLISPICGEICGGSVREDSLQELERRIKGIKSDDSLDWYLDLRRFGNQIHGGFGIGFDRLLQSITGIKNIRDLSPFPRYWHKCDL